MYQDICYGDEIGMNGKGDSECRQPFNWKEYTWDENLIAKYKSLLKLRKERDELKYGIFFELYVDDYAFSICKKTC